MYSPFLPVPWMTSKTGYVSPFCTSIQIGIAGLIAFAPGAVAGMKSMSYVIHTWLGFDSWLCNM